MKKIVESGELNALFLLFVIAKIWSLGAEVIFLPKNFIFENLQLSSKTNAVSNTFGPRYNHGQSVKEIDFPIRNAVDWF